MTGYYGDSPQQFGQFQEGYQVINRMVLESTWLNFLVTIPMSIWSVPGVYQQPKNLSYWCGLRIYNILMAHYYGSNDHGTGLSQGCSSSLKIVIFGSIYIAQYMMVKISMSISTVPRLF